MQKQNAAWLTVGAIMTVLALLAVFGWGSNIYELVTAYETMGLGEVILRVVGIPIAFIGAIMGYC
tara:strand:+ start:343 stop:537 length:195 start_codon:yes stop_codon:yes gene_type:complete